MRAPFPIGTLTTTGLCYYYALCDTFGLDLYPVIGSAFNSQIEGETVVSFE